MYRIGIDLGGTNIAAGLVNDNYTIIQKHSIPTNAAGRTGEDIVQDIAALCLKLCEDAGVTLQKISTIGIASPGLVNSDTGTVEYANNLPFRGFPLCTRLTEHLGHPHVHAQNDANAAAYAEAIAGAAVGAASSVTITLGTGVGGGMVLNGEIYSGFNHAAGELGHMVIQKNGVLCTCGRKGCWEAYSSATALIRMTGEKLRACRNEGVHTVMEDLTAKTGGISGRTAFDAMRMGDKAACDVVNTYISYLATGLANIINLFQPQVICIGGGLSNERDALLTPLLPLVRAEQYGSSASAMTDIRIAMLGNDAGIIGAAFLGT